MADALSVVIMVLLVVVFVASVLTRSAPLSRLRSVRGRQTFVPPAFSVIAVFGYTTATTRRLRHPLVDVSYVQRSTGDDAGALIPSPRADRALRGLDRLGVAAHYRFR